MKEFFKYGEKVIGYDVRVINEREARAAAGILFAIGILSFNNAVMINHAVVTRFYISFFALDFLIRVINPKYSPSMLLGRFFVRDQTPEYVGAAQKRFAWGIGVLLAVPMFYSLGLHWEPSPLKVLICLLCLILLFLESAFSICLGCKIYNLVMPNKATHCPGGVCEMKTKEPIQKFTTVQKFIVSVTFISIFYALYSYMYKLENNTMMGQYISFMMMSDKKKQILENKEYQNDVNAFENDDDF